MRFDGQRRVGGPSADGFGNGVPSPRAGHASTPAARQGPDVAGTSAGPEEPPQRTEETSHAGRGSDRSAAATGRTGTGSGSTETMDKDDKSPGPRANARRVAHQTGAVVNGVRSKVASLVWLVALLCAVVLALAAILLALDANPDNGIVSVVNDLAHKIDGPFWDMFTFNGKNAASKQVLVNWGIGALGYLVVGRVLERIIRP